MPYAMGWSGIDLAAGLAIDDAQAMRHADAELLSLALIDARNCTLARLAMFEDAGALRSEHGVSPLWAVGHAGWFQEFWVARHVQRQRGEAAATDAPRLASIDPRADEWFGGATRDCAGLDTATVRAYLAETLDTTLELLGSADVGDEALYVYRMVLLHEDRLGESLAELAAARQLKVHAQLGAPPSRVDREALWLPAQRMSLGSSRAGFVPENERWTHEVTLPEFEIDAQPVNWARYVQFAEDGGYDERTHWSDAGWDWLERAARRAPRDVEQMRGGVLVMRHGAMQRAPAGQAVMHIGRHEARAWCHWAARRLPTEPEWELAAMVAASRGFVWGDVFEWVAGSARAWPAHAPTPDGLDSMPTPGTQGVLRGGSWLTRKRRLYAKARRFAAPGVDDMFCGFRSCAL